MIDYYLVQSMIITTIATNMMTIYIIHNYYLHSNHPTDYSLVQNMFIDYIH